MAKVYKKAKNGTTYVYDSVSYWDKDLKQPRSKRKLIGKLDPDTGEIIPTGKKDPRPNCAEPVSNTERLNSEDVSSSVSVPAECGDAASPSGIRDEASFRVLYEECRRKLLETEAELAKAKSTVAVLTSKIEKYKEQYRRKQVADLKSFIFILLCIFQFKNIRVIDNALRRQLFYHIYIISSIF